MLLPLQIYCKDDKQLPICPPDFAPICMGDRAFDQVQKDFASTTGPILTPEELQNVLTSIPMLCYMPTILFY